MDQSREGCQSWINGGRDCPVVAAGDEELGDAGNDDNLALSSNFRKSGLQVADLGAVDDLGGLHGDTRRNIQTSHIAPDVGVTNDREESMRRHDVFS